MEDFYRNYTKNDASEKEKRQNYTNMFDIEKRYKKVTPPPTDKEEKETKEERVLHPSHYTWLKDICGIEVIDITRHLNFNLGNVIKYVLRSGHKSEEGMSSRQKQIEDLQKAIFYLNDEIKRLEDSNGK